ncbi:MAG: AAA family ATPase [bacterium]
MAVSTATKRNIVDFLWEWGESNGEWGKLLISKIIGTETNLTIEDKKEVFDYFLQSIKLKSGLPDLAIKKPVYSPSTKKIDIISLSEVKGVNKLALDQTITFADNITVIYGENGSGKTGYGRILKALGYSYELYNNILCDITKPQEPQTATIKYRVDGVDGEFNWDGKAKNSSLENISIFNNNCVQISLADRGLLVSPIGFHLFNLVSDELGYLARLWQETIDKYPTLLLWATNLHPGTLQENFISNLKGNSSLPRLTEISTFDDGHKTSLADCELELKNLNKALLEKELANFRTQLGEIDVILGKVLKAQKALNENTWVNLVTLNKQLHDLEAKTKVGLKEIAETNNIDFYLSKEFQAFIKAADEYIKILNKDDYPKGESETCVYCKQELKTENSIALLRSYRKLLNDNTQELIKKAKDSKTSIIQLIAAIEVPLIFHQDTFGRDSDGKIVQPEGISKYNKLLASWKAIVDKGEFDEIKFDLDYTEYITFLESRKTKTEEAIKLKIHTIDNISIKEKELIAKINELKDREFLSTRTEDVKKAIANKVIVSTLLNHKSSFSTNTISRKTTEAREELVQTEFNKYFTEELKALRKSNIKIELTFGTSKGNSRLQQRINTSYILSDILSEGEQKAIALAEFLTELQLDKSKSPVIFDDPVNSLDHHIIEDVSRRLLTLSRSRQVIIFTHSILLFNSIMHNCKLATYKDLQKILYDIRSEYGLTGVISITDADIDQVKKPVVKIRTLLNNLPKGRRENDVAAEGFGELRAAIELLVEHHIFRGTVKRYQPNIALTNFIKVDGLLVNKNKDKLNEIYERCCRYTNAHSNPEEVITQPTVAELKLDFDEFETIHKQFPI